MTTEVAQSALRRLRFAADWRFRLDRALVAVGRRRDQVLSSIFYPAGNLGYDVIEAVRTGRLQHLARPYMTALDEPMRLPQDRRYRGYWYDASSHSLVGLHLGMDLNCHRGKYHFIESNTNVVLRAERRRLYEARVDPMIGNIALTAKAQGFEKVVLYRQSWTDSECAEFAHASKEFDLEVVGVTLATENQRGSSVNPIIALPEPLEPRTMYVKFSTMHWGEPIFHFVHDKALVSRWLTDAIALSGASVTRLACVPSYDQPVLRMTSDGDRWPNLVVKLASFGKGQYVAMGRFESEAEARRGLMLDNHPGACPGVFRRPLWHRVRDRLSGSSRTVYQPFIPPEVVDGRARLIRLHVLVSPLVDAFLSANGVLAAEELPDRVEPGLVTNQRPYVVNYSNGARYCGLEPEKEEELRQVAQEFGRCARQAIGQKFHVSPQ